MRRLSSFFGLAFLAGLLLASMNGCNGELATVLSSDDAATQPTGGDASSSECPNGHCVDGGPGNGDSSTTGGDCAKFGGVCLPKGESAPPNRKPAGPGQGTCGGTDVCWVLETTTPIGQACVKDPDCNPDPNVSSLYGQCFHGVCVCNIGSVQVNGKCGFTVTECPTQGGTCHQQPATCPAGKIPSDQATNMTCGDLIEAVCCLDPSKCKGPGINGVPVDFACCMQNGGVRDPICANGWKTCPGNTAPVDKSKGGCI